MADPDALASELLRAGLVETYRGDHGGTAYRQTPHGARVWRMLAMSDPDDGQALLDALLKDGLHEPRA
jgi:hypothetical protein